MARSSMKAASESDVIPAAYGTLDFDEDTHTATSSYAQLNESEQAITGCDKEFTLLKNLDEFEIDKDNQTLPELTGSCDKEQSKFKVTSEEKANDRSGTQQKKEIDLPEAVAEVKDNVQPSVQDFEQFTVNILKQLEESTAEESPLAILGQCVSLLGNLTKAIDSSLTENNKHSKDRDTTTEGIVYNQLGLAQGRLGNFHEAIEYHEQDLQLAKVVGDRAAEGCAYQNLGNAYHNLGDFKTAIDYHSRSLEIAEEVGDRQAKGSAYGNLGNAHFGLGDFKTALNFYNKHLKIAKEVGDTSGEKMSYVNLGVVHYSLGDYETAIKYHERALKLSQEIGDRVGEGRVFANLGNAYHSRGDFKTAIEYHTSNLIIAKEMSDRTAEEAAYCNLGLAHENIGEYQTALHYHQCCLQIAKEVGNRDDEGRAYGNIGIVYQRLGDFQTAIDYYERDLKMAKEVGNRVGESSTYGNLGNAYNSLGEFKRAINYHERNFKIAKEIGDIAGEGMACGNLGNAHLNLGDFNTAMDYFARGLQIAKKVGNKAGIGKAYSNLGSAHLRLGDFKKAIDYLERSCKVAKSVGDRSGEEKAYCNLGNLHFQMGNFKTAMDYFARDLQITKEMENRAGEGLAYCNLGNAYFIFGDVKKALDYHKRGLEIAKEIGDRPAEGRAYGNLGCVYHSLEDFKRTLDCHEHCLKVMQELGDDVGLARSFYNLGRCLESQGDLEEAIKHYKHSVTTFNSIRKCLQLNDELKISLRNMYQDVYVRLWRLLLKQGKVVEALFSAEQGRAQALMDLMEIKYGFQTTNTESSETVKDVHGMLSRLPSTTVFIAIDKLELVFWICRKGKDIKLRKRLISNNGSQDDVTTFFQSLMQITWQEIGVRSDVKCEDRSWSKQMGKKAVNERPGQKSLASSFCGEKLVMKDAMEGLIDRNNHSRKDLRHGVTTFFQSLKQTKLAKTRSGRARFDSTQLGENALRTFHDVIVGPIADLAQDNELVFVPEGPLCLAPYAAFMDSNSKYLCESFKIRVVPSLTSLKLMADCPEGYHSNTGALLVGDPWVEEVTSLQQLPFAREEVQMIGKILHTPPLIGKKATKNEVLKRLSSVALVHIAAHGRMETGEIALAPNVTQPSQIPGEEDFVLTMEDVLSVQMRAKLVVLSCCHSAHGEIKAEGVVGIARAFLGAGARSVLVSLWAIDDEATMEFMKHFYQHLVKGTTASEALNQAMKCMRQSEKFRAVKYWAPFVLIGDDVTVELERRK